MISKHVSLLKTRRFLPLFITQFLGAFNDNTFKNALVILIAYRATLVLGMGSEALVVFAAAIFILPFFLFSSLAGELADKYSKTLLVKIIKSVEVLLMGVAVVGFYWQSASLLLLVLFFLGAHATFFGPIKYALLPEQLSEDELLSGNGLIEAGTFIAILLGTIIGGGLILKVNGLTCVSVLICATAMVGLLASFFIPSKHKTNAENRIHYNIFKETIKLIQYSKNRKDIFLSILGISWFWAFGSIFISEFPMIAKEILHGKETIITLFLTIFSIGLAVGSMLASYIQKGKIHATYVPLGILGMTIFALDFYFTLQSVPTISQLHLCIDLALMALCGGIYSVPLYAIVQARSEKAHRARVIASNNIFNALFMVMASIVAIVLLKLGVTVAKVILIFALVNGLVAIYICKLLPDIIIKSILRVILKALYRVEIKGLEHYRNAGERVVIVANHTSFLDAVLLGTFLPDKLTFAVNTHTNEHWWVKIFTRLVDAYPMDATNPLKLKSLIEFVQQDKRCVIFPEGRITMTGSLMKIYEGPGLIADKCHAPLLPIRIQGAQFTPFSRLRGKVNIRLFPKITITVFPPEYLQVAPEVKGRLRRQKISLALYDIMSKMIFESSHYHRTLFKGLLDAKSIHDARLNVLEDVERKPLNYREIVTRSFILGKVIARKTVMHEHVGLLLPNAVSSTLTFFALQAYSRVPAMLNYSAGANAVSSSCQAACVKTVYTSRRFIQLARLDALLNELRSRNIEILFLEDIVKQISYLDKIRGVCQGAFPRLAYKAIHLRGRKPHSNDIGAILFTSGSEGTPKGVALSHANIMANCYQLGASIDFTSSDIVFNALPIFHSFGLTAGLLLPLISGVKVFLYPSPLHYRIVPELCYDTNATILYGTDTFLQNYAKYAHPYDFYSIRYVFAGAEKLRHDTRLLWQNKFGIRVFEGYGATETSPVMAINTPMHYKENTVGRLLPGIQYQVHSVPGIEKGGVLQVSGSNVMLGYFMVSNPGKLIACDQGWYDTGDIVEIDQYGFVSIQGRMKRFAKIAGEMVSLTMVEEKIKQLWPNQQHAIISVADEKKGEQLILATTYVEADKKDILAFAKAEQLSEISLPKKIKVFKQLPLLGSGKIDYVTLKGMVLV